MCCFSRPIRSVTGTNIFARSGVKGRQYVVYSMRLDTPEDVAMILPIPVKAGAGERAVRFIDLQGYPQFFVDLRQAFYPPPPSRAAGGTKSAAAAPALQVHQVGSFEASYVPTVRDFSRLDARFRLPAGTWEQLPQYKNYGFTVFKLKPGARVIHPMAFDFPRADPKRLFFPTVHIHDGKIHSTAGFDHFLYCQRSEGDAFSLLDWKESERFAESFINTGQSKSLVLPKEHLYLKVMRGRMKNQDTWVA
jgi:hypothetical protein